MFPAPPHSSEELFLAGKFTWVYGIVVVVFYKGFISEMYNFLLFQIENVQKHYCYGVSLFDHVPLFNNSFRSDNMFFLNQDSPGFTDMEAWC